MTCLLGFFTLFLLLVRPYIAPYENFMEAAIALFETLMMICTLFALGSEDPDPSAQWGAVWAGRCAAVALWAIVVKFLMDLGVFLVDEYCDWGANGGRGGVVGFMKFLFLLKGISGPHRSRPAESGDDLYGNLYNDDDDDDDAAEEMRDAGASRSLSSSVPLRESALRGGGSASRSQMLDASPVNFLGSDRSPVRGSPVRVTSLGESDGEGQSTPPYRMRSIGSATGWSTRIPSSMFSPPKRTLSTVGSSRGTPPDTTLPFSLSHSRYQKTPPVPPLSRVGHKARVRPRGVTFTSGPGSSRSNSPAHLGLPPRRGLRSLSLHHKSSVSDFEAESEASATSEGARVVTPPPTQYV
eukprot:TRINITY_DN5688_c0_g1_i1.p1 TRINITY_DN5688_c0_g1~~TRINITY_DN5688_c0_g1_i1.p1  ORF type:complete len:376 (+),score=36.89 TRINITY_DN5688_c0_g1_i1:69-1130(+)